MTYFEDLGLTPVTGNITVEMVVNGDVIKMQVDGVDAPVTASNFVDLVERGIYNATKFHRIESGFVAQGGDPQSKDPNVSEELLGTGGFIDPKTNQERNIPLEIKPMGADEPIYSKTLADAEITTEPFLPHSKGAIAMARTAEPDTASSQFYFALDDLPQLDGDYAVFGGVTEGMNVVENITKGDTIQFVAVTDGSVTSRKSSLITDFDLLNSFINDTNTTKIEYTLAKAKPSETQESATGTEETGLKDLDNSGGGENTTITTETAATLDNPNNQLADELGAAIETGDLNTISTGITTETAAILDDPNNQLATELGAAIKTGDSNTISTGITTGTDESFDSITTSENSDNGKIGKSLDDSVSGEIVDDDPIGDSADDNISEPAGESIGNNSTGDTVHGTDELTENNTDDIAENTESISGSSETENSRSATSSSEEITTEEVPTEEVPTEEAAAEEITTEETATEEITTEEITAEETTTAGDQNEVTDDASITTELSPEDQTFVNTLLDKQNDQVNDSETRAASGHDSNTGIKDDLITTRTAAIMALGGDDQIQGTNDNNVINGNEGNDDILGLDGHDFLRGGKGNDQLSGGLGNDFLVGDYGIDTLTGNEGIDHFVLRASTEKGVTSQDLADVITDFSVTDGDRISVIADFITETDLIYESSGDDTILKLGTTGDILALVKGASQSIIEQNISIVGTSDIALTRIG